MSPPLFGSLRLLLALASAGLAGPSHALSYAQALSLAEQQHPALRAQQLAVDATTAAQGAAQALPDPRLGVGVENLPISGMDRGSLTRDFMTMRRIALMQEVPNAAKRSARAEASAARADRERALLVVQRLQVRQALASAWVSVQSLSRRQAVLAALAAENQTLQQTLLARIAAGTAPPTTC